MMDKRATLTCASNESCKRYTDGSLLCLDSSTGMLIPFTSSSNVGTDHTCLGDYHDDVGGEGNANTGVYTYSDGTVTTILAGQTAAARTDLASATASATGADDSIATASSGSSTATRTGSSASAAAATASGNAAAEKIGAGVVVGALGLFAGLVL